MFFIGSSFPDLVNHALHSLASSPGDITLLRWLPLTQSKSQRHLSNGLEGPGGPFDTTDTGSTSAHISRTGLFSFSFNSRCRDRPAVPHVLCSQMLSPHTAPCLLPLLPSPLYSNVSSPPRPSLNMGPRPRNFRCFSFPLNFFSTTLRTVKCATRSIYLYIIYCPSCIKLLDLGILIIIWLLEQCLTMGRAH